MDYPLVFLTSSSDTVPSGRNARAVARASMVRQNSRSISARGTFNTFSVIHSRAEEKLRRSKCSPNSLPDRQFQHASAGELTTQHYARNIPRVIGPQNFSINELLTTATIRIRHNLAPALKKEPSNVRDYLRRRQWAAAAFALDTLHLTPEVHSAVRYLEHKILTREGPKQSHEIELQMYGSALSELQQSLRDPERRMQSSVLAASHILAICEMLDDTTNGHYVKFVNGIVSLSTLQAHSGDHYARINVRSRAGAILVDSLLTRRYDVVLDQPWSHILVSAGEKGDISLRDALHFADSAEMIFQKPTATHASTTSQMTAPEKVATAAKAYDIYLILKQSIQRDLLQPGKTKYTCPLTETIGERIAVMLALEDFISGLNGVAGEFSELIQNDSYSFYANALSAI